MTGQDGWSWKVQGPEVNEELGLLYEPGTWGDVIKGAWAAAVARELVRAGRRPLRYLDPFAGAATYPLVEATANRLAGLPTLELRGLLDPHLEAGRFPSTALLVQAAAEEAGAECRLGVFDVHTARRKTWEGRPGCTLLEVADGGAALPATDVDLLLVDPYDLFEGAERLLPLALGGPAETAVLLYLFNKAPRGAAAHGRYVELRARLDELRGERGLLVGRVSSDAILPRAFHELILVAPTAICQAARAELERVTLGVSRHLSDAGAFEG